MGAFPQKSYTGIWPNYKSEMFKYDYSVIKRGGEAQLRCTVINYLIDPIPTLEAESDGSWGSWV